MLNRKHVFLVQMAGLVSGFIFVLPWIPDQGMGPYRSLNPNAIVKLALVLITISTIGNKLIETISGERGFLITGFLGGFTSSTATIIGMAHLTKEQPSIAKLAASAAIASNVATYVQLSVLIGMVSLDLLSKLILPVMTGIVMSILLCWLSYTPHGYTPPQNIIQTSFFYIIKRALTIVLLLGIMMVCIGFAKEMFGANGVYFAALLSGFVDGHASAVTLSEMTIQHKLTFETVLVAILLSLTSNSISRSLFTGLSQDSLFCRRVAGALMLTLASSWFALWIILSTK